MSQKNVQQLQEEKTALEMNKSKLEAVKKEQPEKWTSAMEVKLGEIIGEIADIEESILKAVESAEEKKEAEYVPEKGTEKMVHLMIVRGRRFNPNTGVEESKPHLQMFTYGEFILFKNNAASLGYSVLKVLHDPYNEASSLIVK